MNDAESIAVIGGTGKLGSAIARRLAKAGCRVVIGSRSADRADQFAREMGLGVVGTGNADAAAAGDIIIVTVPFASLVSTLTEILPHLAGKIVVDATVPLMPPKDARVQLAVEGSARCNSAAVGRRNRYRGFRLPQRRRAQAGKR